MGMWQMSASSRGGSELQSSYAKATWMRTEAITMRPQLRKACPMESRRAMCMNAPARPVTTPSSSTD
eukprot:754202-Hanusia_phi.AAC.2